MKKLSAYTVASNCTDLTDIRDGIAEIHEAMKTCVESGKHIPSFYVSRLAKLETKKKKLEKRTQVHNLFSSSNLCIRKKFHGIQKRDDSGLGIIG
ncbi:hypothetical protein ABHZ54_17410 [Bacteroides uniformis]